MVTPVSAGRGRPRTFDRERALKAAMDLFWSRGYDGVSLEDLQKAMGNISPPSFYAAFGSKDGLFREVVALYRQSMGERVAKALMMSPVRDAIEAMMRAIVDEFLRNELAPGCLVILGAVNNTRTSHEAHKLLAEMRCEGSEMIRKRLLKAVHDGELPEGLPLGDIAGFYTTVLHGLAIRARDGATKASMLAAVNAAMAAWPSLIKPDRKRSKKR
jgi:AcrR family transcriptional regulator